MTLALKSKKLFVAGIVALLILAVLGGAMAYSDARQNSPQNQLSLGQKFLEKLDYESAILCFNKVIEVEPKSANAYLGLADAYIGKGDTASAEGILRRGLEFTRDSRLSAKLETLGAILTAEQTQLLQSLMDALEQKNTDVARSIMEDDTFQQILKSQPITDRIVEDDGFEGYSQNLLFGDTENGLGMRCSYNYFTRIDQQFFELDYSAYYGKWANGRKEGAYLVASCSEGFSAYDMETTSDWGVSECTYKDGTANGALTTIGVDKADGEDSGFVRRGYLVDGYLHGKVVFAYEEGGTYFSYYENGMPIPAGPPNERGLLPTWISDDGICSGYLAGEKHWTVKRDRWGG